MDPRIQLAAASGLAATPWWASWIDLLHKGAGTIAAVCGAILGVVAVYRWWTQRKGKENDPS
jgi:hypothetical protein